MARGPGLHRTLVGHGGPVLDLAFSPSGSKLVTASGDGTARIWLWKPGRELLVLRGHAGVVYSATFTAEGGGRRVITGGHDRVIIVWEAETGAALQRMENVHAGWILGLGVRSDGLQFASASGDRTIGVWRSLPLTVWDDQRACLSAVGRALTGDCLTVLLNSRAVKAQEREDDKRYAGAGGKSIIAKANARVAPGKDR